MKRKSAESVPEALNMLDRSVVGNNENENVASLLRDIRDELRQHNEVLRSLKQSGPPSPGSTAPVENNSSDGALL
jgi:hypothetical protein